MNIKQHLTKVLLTATFLGLPFSVPVLAQDLTIHVDKKGKVGFVDNAGNEVVKCIYESAYPFEKGYAIVSKSGKSGIIDATGKVVLPLKYTSIDNWSNDLFLIKDGKSQGLASRDGKIVLQPKCSFISRPNCYGVALYAIGGKVQTIDKVASLVNSKMGIINSKGEVLVEANYKGLYEFAVAGKSDNFYGDGFGPYVTTYHKADTLMTDCSYFSFNTKATSDQCGVMDIHGNVLMKPGLHNLAMKPANGMIRYFDDKRNGTIFGYYNIETGKSFVATTIDQPAGKINSLVHGDFADVVAPVKESGWKFVNKNGDVVRSGFSNIKHNGDVGLWGAKDQSGKWIVFDENNNDVPALSGFTDINFPMVKEDAEVYTVQKDGVYGGVNRSGATVIPFKYQKANANGYDFVPVKSNDHWGAVSPTGEEIIPTSYVDIMYPSKKGEKDLWVKKADNLFYHYHADTKKLAPRGYESASNFTDGVAHVRPVDMQLDETEVNHAQVYVPNTIHTKIDSVEIEKYRFGFGYLLKANDQWLLDLPVSALYVTPVMDRMKKLGYRNLSEAEKKNILLEVTRENRSYGLKETLKEDEWNY